MALPEAASGRFETPLGRDPFAVPLSEKADLMARAADAARRSDGVRVARGILVSHRQETTFLASNGSAWHQAITLAGGGTYSMGTQGGDLPPWVGIPGICLAILVWAVPILLWVFLVRNAEDEGAAQTDV